MRRLLTALALGVLLALGLAAPASAHAGLVSTTPTAGSVAAREPSEVRLQFTEPVEVGADAVRISGPDGRRLPGAATRDPAAADTVRVRLPRSLHAGTYTVEWHVVSIDGHVVSGVFRFANGHASAPLTGPAPTNGAGPGWLAGAGRALALSGALALLGLLVFPVLVVGPVRRRLGTGAALDTIVERRLRTPTLVAAVAGLAGTVVVLLDTAAAAATPLAPFLAGTRTGALLGVRILVLTVAAGLLALPRLRRWALLPAVAALLAVPFSSHAAAASVDRPLAIGLDLAHLAAAALWAGGLLALAVAGLPAARDIGGRDRAAVGDLAGALSARFSTLAQLAMVVLLGTGGYAALLHLTAVQELGRTAWGVALTVKLALFATVLLFALAGAVTFVPAIAGRAARSANRLAAAGELRSAIRAELGLAAGLLLVTAVLSATAPPAHSATDGGPVRSARAQGSAAGYTADVAVDRRGTGAAAATVFTVALSSEGEPASAPSASASLRGPDGVVRTMPLVLAEAGHWTSDRLSVAPGTYRLLTRFDRLGNPIEIPVTVAVPR